MLILAAYRSIWISADAVPWWVRLLAVALPFGIAAILIGIVLLKERRKRRGS